MSLGRIFYRKCDRCCGSSPTATTSARSLALAKNAGWLRRAPYDFCKSCRKIAFSCWRCVGTGVAREYYAAGKHKHLDKPCTRCRGTGSLTDVAIAPAEVRP
jgi:hypothetical protein